MTAKEKARELIDKIHDELPCHSDDWKVAKKIALITVDEMIDLLVNASEYLAFPEQIKYLQEVKKYISYE